MLKAKYKWAKKELNHLTYDPTKNTFFLFALLLLFFFFQYEIREIMISHYSIQPRHGLYHCHASVLKS